MEKLIGQLLYMIYSWVYYLLIILFNVALIPVILGVLYFAFKFIILGDI